MIRLLAVTALLLVALIAALALALGVILLTIGYIPFALVLILALSSYLLLASGALWLLHRRFAATPVRLVLMNALLALGTLATFTVLSVIGGLA